MPAGCFIIMHTLADEARSDAKWASLGVAVGVWAIFKLSPWIGVPLTLLFLAEGLLLWQRRKAGVYLALLICLLGAAWFGMQIFLNGFSGTRVALCVVMLFSLWAYWNSYGDLVRGRASWTDPDDKDERVKASGDTGEDKPMTSIVLLRRTPKFLDDKVLLESLRDAWDESRKLGEDELFVAGDGPLHIVKSPQGMWMVHNHARPYFEGENPAGRMPELRLRKALEDHAAWLSVDLMHGFLGDLPADVYYPYIFRLVRELADDDTLAILRPETGEINVWTDEVAKRLGAIDPLEEFSTPVHSPVISVSDDDPRMKAAVAEARDGFSTFREHWSTRGPDDSFLVKAAIRRNGLSEIIWIEVAGLEPEFIHGTLGNEPVDLEGLQMGDRVEVPVSDLYDWAIAKSDADGPMGLFTEKVVRTVQREAREALERTGPDASTATS